MTQDRPRRLGAVWFADIVGYTDLSARDEDLALRVVRELQRISRKHCQARGGRVVKLMGDAVLTVFDSVDAAVRAAIALRDDFLASDEARAAGVSVRVGLHLGELADGTDGDVYGDAVNVASRIERVAEPGQVVLSQVAFLMVQQRTVIEAEDLGEFELRGLKEPMRLYSARLLEEAEAAGVRELLQEAIAPLQLLDVEGIGGMGEIYLARDPGLRRTLAVKVLKSELVADAQARTRFQREATVIAGLSHPNVITIHSVGELKDETPYFVMDFIEGGSLADRLEREGPLSVPETRRILGEVASALEAAHGKGIVHRDIKAANVLWDLESGRALVTDWGIAALDPTAEYSPEARLTKTGVVVGSPQYMSPEQLAGDEVGPETDVYSLGLLAFELLTGHGPFPAETPREIMVSHLREDPPDLSKIRKDVDPELDVLVAQCLSKTPRERPTVSEVARLSPGVGARVEWPPPSLEFLRGAAYRMAFWLALPLLAVALPLVFSRSLEGDPGVIILLFSTVFMHLFLAGCIWYGGKVVVALVRAVRLGYSWRTISEVLADRSGDGGLLIDGVREYAVLGSEERRRLRSRRIARAFTALAGVLVVLPGAAFLAAAFNLFELWAGYWWILVLALLICLPLLRRALKEPKQVKRARSSFIQAGRSSEQADSLVESWHRSVEGSGVAGIRRAKPSWWVPAVVAGMTLTALAITIVIGSVLVGVQAIAYQHWGLFLDAEADRWPALAELEDLRFPRDESITPAEAGRLAAEIVLWNAGRGEASDEDPRWESLRGSPLLFRAPDSRLGIFTLQFDSLIAVAARGITSEEREYLTGFLDVPIFGLFEQLARAEAVEWFVDNESGPELILAFSSPVGAWPLGMAGYHKLAQAAFFTAEGEAAAAEVALREVVSVAFLISDLPNARYDWGAQLIAHGSRGLADLYEAMDRHEEADRLRRALTGLGRETTMDSPDGSGSTDLVIPRDPASSDPVQAAYRRAADSTLPRGLRWASMVELLRWSDCGNLRNVLLGRPEEVDTFLEALRPRIVRFPSEEPHFNAIAEHVDRLGSHVPDSFDVLHPGRYIPGRFASPLISPRLVVAVFDFLGLPRMNACLVLAQTSWF